MSNFGKYLLKLCVCSNHPSDLLSLSDSLLDKYREKITSYNLKNSNSLFPDSGFDLFNPWDFSSIDYLNTINNETPFGVPLRLGVKCAAFYVDDSNRIHPSGFYLYPRSSISKTPFRLANSLGIIDAGYRGEIIAMVDSIYPNYNVEQLLQYGKRFDRLFQICSPDLTPFRVELVNQESDLGFTERGSGGFGSTN